MVAFLPASAAAAERITSLLGTPGQAEQSSMSFSERACRHLRPIRAKVELKSRSDSTNRQIPLNRSTWLQRNRHC